MSNVNIVSREFKANPYPFYARLRAESPVYRTVLPDKQVAWLITRYDDVMLVLKDDQRFLKNMFTAKTPEQLRKMPWVPPMFRPFLSNLLAVDGADHARLRGLVHKAFTPHRIEGMKNRVQSLANDLLDGAEKRGSMDLIKDYALPIPLTIIAEMLGISPADQQRFSRWMRSLLSLNGSGNELRGIPSLFFLTRYLRRIFKERRRNPTDDLLTALVQAEESGDKLSEDELLSMVFVLLIAGHETTLNLIGSGTLALLENPDQLALLRQKPELAKNAVEELLRYVSPVEQATERYTAEPVTLHGVTIPRGEMVLAVIASANRDEHCVERPDVLDITRENPRHVAFGQGVHYCVGAPLARLEGQIALTALAQRLPRLRLAQQSSALRWRPGLTVRGLEALPVLV